MISVVEKIYDAVTRSAVVGRISRDEALEVVGKLRSLEERFKVVLRPEKATRLNRYREVLHDVFIKRIRRMPRDVVVSNPGKYGALFPRDVVDAMKRVGLVRGFPL